MTFGSTPVAYYQSVGLSIFDITHNISIYSNSALIFGSKGIGG